MFFATSSKGQKADSERVGNDLMCGQKEIFFVFKKMDIFKVGFLHFSRRENEYLSGLLIFCFMMVKKSDIYYWRTGFLFWVLDVIRGNFYGCFLCL